MNFKDLTGKKFGKLLVLSFSHWKPRKDNKRRPYWNCLCDCGKETKTHLNSGRVRSCGCLRKENAYNKLPVGMGSAKNLYGVYRNHAKNRNLEFQITFNNFLELTAQNCYYCNMEPKQGVKQLRGNGKYIYNGIDRVDNDLRIFIK